MVDSLSVFIFKDTRADSEPTVTRSPSESIMIKPASDLRDSFRSQRARHGIV